jgi:hypothetical protein
MIDYIQLKASNEASYKRVRVLHADWSTGLQQPRDVQITLTGAVNKTIGVAKRVWTGVMRIKYTPEANYASRADIEKWFAGGLLADQTLTLIDHFNTTYQVTGMSDPVFIAISPVEDGSSSYYLVNFSLIQL